MSKSEHSFRLDDYYWSYLSSVHETTKVSKAKYIEAGVILICERLRRGIPIWDHDGEIILEDELDKVERT